MTAYAQAHAAATARRAQLADVERVAGEICHGGQRQDSLDEQLADVERLATVLGCEAAADWIRVGR